MSKRIELLVIDPQVATAAAQRYLAATDPELAAAVPVLPAVPITLPAVQVPLAAELRRAAAGMVAPLALAALVLGSVMLLFATAFFGLPLEWDTAALALPLGLLGAFAFAPFSLLMSASVLAWKQSGGGASFIVTGIALRRSA